LETLEDYVGQIDNPQHRGRMEEVLTWVKEKFPNLESRIAWNQPMFTDHGTYIIGFSISKKHLAVAPEAVGINHFSDDIVQAGYDYTKQLVRIPWEKPIDFSLLERIIKFNIADKLDCTTFWRK
jgi:uncharacterized protein